MAPIQKNSFAFMQERNMEASTKNTVTSNAISSATNSYTIKSNSASTNSNSQANNSSNISHSSSHLDTGDACEVLLPIVPRGQFYHDTFFEDLRQHYDGAVKHMLDLWDTRSSLHDDLVCYQRMRDLDLTQDNQAHSITQDDTAHTVVIDVRDFMKGDLKVKMVDENELVVEGTAEMRQDGSASKKSFCRRFTFPGLVSAETVTSSMSSDGVLTVTVPKKVSSLANKTSRNIQISAASEKFENQTKHVETEQKQIATNSTQFNKSDETVQSTTSTFKDKNNEETSHIDKEKAQSVMANSSQIKQNKESVEIESHSSKDSKTSNNNSILKDSHFVLPVCERGEFFQDNFFEDVRKQFESSMQDMVNKWGESTTASDVIASYRSLRERDLQEKNQAMTLIEDQHCHKIVLDVRDFKESDVKVKVVDENELIIEGSVEKRMDNSVSKKSFLRRFIFPGLVGANSVSSALSSDGVLSVSVQKVNSTTQDLREEKSTSLAESSTLSSLTNSQVTTQSASSCINESASKESHKEKQHDEEASQVNIVNSDDKASPAWLCEPSLPTRTKGLFFSDSFFEDIHQEFDSAVKEVLERHSAMNSVDDPLSCYRSLRQRELRDETQAIKTIDDQHSYKVVLDVHDFKDGDVTVKMQENNEIVVEGRLEKKDNGFSSSRSFVRRFTVPASVNLYAITSIMSSDGVLIVTVPKKATMTANKATRNIQESNACEKLENRSKHIENKQKQMTASSSQITKSDDTFQSKKSLGSDQSSNSIFEEKKTEKESGLIEKQNSQSVMASSSQINQHEESIGMKSHISKDLNTSINKNSLEDSRFVLPVCERGGFFQDSFFEDVRKQFESAMQEMVERWGETTNASDVMTNYRILRERDLQEKNQAMTLIEDQQCHKIVLDVRDFKESDVKVKVVDENELVIEGSVEKRQDNSVSKKSFLRRFFFPGLVAAKSISSVVSSDGVLSVTVQKVNPTSQNLCEEKSLSVMESNTLSSRINCNQLYAKTTQSASSCINESSSKESHKEKQHVEEASQVNVNSDNKTSPAWLCEPSLPICPKGLFFSDSFFEDVHQEFDSAVKEVLEQHNAMKRVDDPLSCYRSLRQRELRDETQAIKTIDDQHSYKVVLDVHDFKDGDVKVKVQDNKEVVVEGRVEKKDGGFTSSKNFIRRFTVPARVDLDAITSAMSSDGVLTVTAPKTSN